MNADIDGTVIFHPQGGCPDAKAYRITSDTFRREFFLCDECVAAYSAPPFGFSFTPSDERRRGADQRERDNWWSVG